VATSIIVVSVTAFWGLVVWFVKLILLERYQFVLLGIFSRFTSLRAHNRSVLPNPVLKCLYFKAKLFKACSFDRCGFPLKTASRFV
jgi:hypothetical protein